MRFEYWKTAEGLWAWQLKSAVGDVLAKGAPAPSRETCLSAIKLVKLAAVASCCDVSPDGTENPRDDGLVPPRTRF
jgi:uncharacterized protein YegP (UPF0339 family)